MWQIIKEQEIAGWQKKVYENDGHIFQLPSWLNAFKYIGYLKPVYLKYGNDAAYCGMLVAKMPFMKIALVSNGPVIFDRSVSADACISLLHYLKDAGFVFARFTGSNIDTIINNESYKQVKFETFPFYKDVLNHFYVYRKNTPEELKESFGGKAQKDIDKVIKTGEYRVVADDTGEHSKEVYNLFLRVGSRKGFKYRPYESYRSLFEYNTDGLSYATYYMCYRNDTLVNTTLILRDKKTSLCMSGALDITLIEKHSSPSLFAHLNAMTREFFTVGTEQYDLVYTGGGVGDFKLRFHPELVSDPETTVILSGWKFRLYESTMLKFAPQIKKKVKQVLSKRGK